MDNSGTKPVPYSDLLVIIKEVVQLRTRLTAKSSEQDIRDYKLLTKVFEAYTRIRDHPDIALDTICSVDSKTDDTKNNHQTQDPSKCTSNQQSNQSTSNVIYLFGSNQQDTQAVSDTSEIDSDMDPDELFEDEGPVEKLPDDKDVELMLKKSSFQLNRALNNRNYLVLGESDDSDESEDEGTKQHNGNSENEENKTSKRDLIQEDNLKQRELNSEGINPDKSNISNKSIYHQIDYDDDFTSFEQLNYGDEDNNNYQKYDNDIYGYGNIAHNLSSHKLRSYFRSGYEPDTGSDEYPSNN